MREQTLILLRSIIDLFTSLSYSLAVRIEKEIKRSLGKGYGSESIKSEVRAALTFLTPNSLRDLIVIDAGANIGEYSAAILHNIPMCKVYAFEPSETANALLRKRFESESRIQISNLALGSAPGVGQLWTNFPGSGLASLTKRNLSHLGHDFEKSEQVEIETLDNWCRQRSLIPTLLKIDVEGNELEVLKGASEVLKNCMLVQFEFGGCNIDSRTYFRDFWTLFSNLGYMLYRVTPRGVSVIKFYSEHDESFITTNFIAVNKRFLDASSEN